MKHETRDRTRHDARIDRPDEVRLGSTDTMRSASTGDLAHLGDLDDYKVADGEPDIRGWDVKSADGRKLGEVADVLVDTGTMKVRYVEVKLSEDVAEETARARDTADARTEPVRHVLVPIGVARLDDEHDDVRLDARAARLAGLPAYARAGLTPEYESELLKRYGRADQTRDADGAGFHAGREFDERAFFGKRRRGRDDATYITRSQEQPAVGTRSVEGRAVGGDAARDAARGADVQIGEREIRIPVMAEEAEHHERRADTRS